MQKDNQTVTDTGHPGRIINESVFISYFPEDKQVADTIKKQLFETNIDFFDICDAEDKAAGGLPAYEMYLPGILESCAVFIPICNTRRLSEPSDKDPLYDLWKTISLNGKMKVIPVWTGVQNMDEITTSTGEKDVFAHLPGLVPGNHQDIFCSEKGLTAEAINSVMDELPNPFKGPIPYSRKDRIYGRHTDIMALYDCIRQNKLTLLYSKSGNGKTSLIQAGLIPELEKSKLFIPVYIRVTTSEINSWSAIRELLEKEINEFTDEDKLGYKVVTSAIPGREAGSLFEYLYTTEITAGADGKGQQVIPVLIFDQFEELFTISSSLKNNLLKELEYLLENKMPYSLQEIEPDTEHSEIAYRKFIEKIASKDKPFRIVLSFREEYFLSIENFKDTIPTFFYTNGRYRLESFSVKESKDTIVRISRYTIDMAVAGSLSRLLARIQADMEETEFKEDAKNISPFILSLTCRDIYDELKTGSPQRQAILDADRNNDIAAFRPKVEKAIQNYYENSFAHISDIAKIFIERKLISTEGKRTLFPYNDIKSYFKPENEKEPAAAQLKNQELTSNIDRLVDDTKIRYLNKNKYLNTTHIEILHDQLVHPVKKRRDDRELQEKEERANRDMVEMRQQHQNELDKLRNEEEKKYLERQNKLTKGNNRKLIIGGSLLAGILATIFVLFYNKTVQIVNDFAVVEEKVVLDSKEKTQGTYAALSGAYAFYNKINNGLVSFKVPFSRKMPRLERSIEALLMEAYNKTPCYLVQDIKRLPLGLKNYVKTGNLVYTRTGDGVNNTLYSYNVSNFARDSMVLSPPADSMSLHLNPNQQLNNAQEKDFQSNTTHSLFIVNNSLYVFKIADKLKPVYSVKLGSFPRAEFSADGKFVILSFSVTEILRKMNMGPRFDAPPVRFYYYLISLDQPDASNAQQLTFGEGESLITVVAGRGQSVICYSRKTESKFNFNAGSALPGMAGWQALIKSSFTIVRTVYDDKKIISGPVKLYTGASQDNFPGQGVTNATYTRSAEGRYLFFRETITEPWTAYDLFSVFGEAASKLPAGIAFPIGIYTVNNETVVISSDMQVQSMVDNKAASWKIEIADNQDSLTAAGQRMQIVSVVKSNQPGWVTVYFANAYHAIYPGLIDLANHKAYLLSRPLYLNPEVSFYLEEAKKEKAIVIPGSSYGLSTGVGENSAIHWFYKRLPNDTTLAGVKKWVENHPVKEQ